MGFDDDDDVEDEGVDLRFVSDTREERDCVHERLVDFFVTTVFSFHTFIAIPSPSPQVLPPAAVPHLAAGARTGTKAAAEYIYRPNLEGLLGRLKPRLSGGPKPVPFRLCARRRTGGTRHLSAKTPILASSAWVMTIHHDVSPDSLVGVQVVCGVDLETCEVFGRDCGEELAC